MKKIQRTSASLHLVENCEFSAPFHTSITGGGVFSSFQGEHKHWTNEQWEEVSHLVEVEVVEKTQEGELSGGRTYTQKWGTSYFVEQNKID